MEDAQGQSTFVSDRLHGRRNANLWVQISALLIKNIKLQLRQRKFTAFVILFPLLIIAVAGALTIIYNNSDGKKLGSPLVLNVNTVTSNDGSTNKVAASTFKTSSNWTFDCNINNVNETCNFWNQILFTNANKTNVKDGAGKLGRYVGEKKGMLAFLAQSQRPYSSAYILSHPSFFNSSSSIFSPFFKEMPYDDAMDDFVYKVLQENEAKPVTYVEDDDQYQQYTLPTATISFKSIMVKDQEDNANSLDYVIQLNDMSDLRQKYAIQTTYPPNTAQNLKDKLTPALSEPITDLNNQAVTYISWINSAFASLVYNSTQQQKQQLNKNNYYYAQNNEKDPITISVTTTSFEYDTLATGTFPAADIFICFMLSLGMAFLIPAYVYTIVYEREAKVLLMIKIMGASTFSNTVARFIFNMILYFIQLAVIIIFMFIFQIQLVYYVNITILLYFFIIYGFAQNSFSFFLASLFSNTRTASIVTFVFVLFCMNIFTPIFCFLIYQDVLDPPGSYYFFNLTLPVLALGRGIFILTENFLNPFESKFTLADCFNFTSQLGIVCYFLLASTVFYLIVGLYLEAVIPHTNSTTKPLLFPIYAIMKLFKKKEKSKQAQHSFVDLEGNRPLNKQEERKMVAEEEEEEEGCKEERRKANSAAYPCTLRIRNVSKQYISSSSSANKLALNNFCLTVQDGECFGLLGPNGAGKTTLQKILSGRLVQTSGNITVFNLDLPSELSELYNVLGVCPQFDIYWDDLTVEEHLLFYIRLKGYTFKSQNDVLRDLCERVGLSDHTKKFAKQLSGGMRRRLSLAISLIGDPKVVLLDEPTTGLDPVTRRAVWKIISQEQQNRVTIITTHDMEEADALCTRIGIMSHGELLCIGTQAHLKQTLGTGYKLTISTSNVEATKACILNQLPAATPLDADNYDDAINNSIGNNVYSIMFKFDANELDVPKIARVMQQYKDDMAITAWGITNTTLEEVFLRIVGEDEE